MNVAVELPDEVLDELAARVASRVLAAGRVQTDPCGDTHEPWRLLDVEDVATRLGRSTRWVRERVKRGDLTRIRLDGGKLAFELADVQAFAQARRVSADRVHDDGEPARNGRSRRAETVANRRVGAA
jgi:hypothetical protein